MLELKADCKYYRGDVPCTHARLCEGCPEYDPYNGSILVIKTAAMGDVLRTTSILPAVRRKYTGYKITWLTAASAEPLLRMNPGIDELLVFDHGSLPALLPRKFDILFSLDKTAPECGLASMINAGCKFGVMMSESGLPIYINEEAQYYFELGLSDDLKFRINKKTYHELMREVCCLDNEVEPPLIELAENEKNGAVEAVGKLLGGSNPLTGPRIGIVPGAAGTFVNKTPPAEWFGGLISRLRELIPGAALLLLGGPEDASKIETIQRTHPGIFSFINPDVRVYAGVVGEMDVVFCGDTLALHIATAMKKKIVAVFGPTCEAEISLFGRGEKIVADMKCSPCYKGTCSTTPNCMERIDARSAAMVINGLLGTQP